MLPGFHRSRNEQREQQCEKDVDKISSHSPHTNSLLRNVKGSAAEFISDPTRAEGLSLTLWIKNDSVFLMSQLNRNKIQILDGFYNFTEDLKWLH